MTPQTEQYLEMNFKTPMRRAKAVAALEMQMRFNGEFMTREQIALRLAEQQGLRMNSDQSRLYWLDTTHNVEVFQYTKDITKTVFDYVAWLARLDNCSICRDYHKSDNRHPCE